MPILTGGFANLYLSVPSAKEHLVGIYQGILRRTHTTFGLVRAKKRLDFLATGEEQGQRIQQPNDSLIAAPEVKVGRLGGEIGQFGYPQPSSRGTILIIRAGKFFPRLFAP